MTTLRLRIELPAYSYSFFISVPNSNTVQQVKEEISKACPGQPRAEGQRLICRGRALANEETIGDLWKSSTDSHILHLAVHPSAWTGQPPEIPNPGAPAVTNTVSQSLPPPLNAPFPPNNWRTLQPLDVSPLTIRAPAYQPIPFIAVKHQNALNALMTGTPPLHEGLDDLRQAAKVSIERVGWIWPSILDEPYPSYEAGGLRYELTTIHGQKYLSLLGSDTTPTPVQKHALAILSYTFTLLNLSVTASAVLQTQATQSATSPVPPQLNQLLRQLGMPQLRVVQNHNQNQNEPLPQVRELPIRPLLMPLFMLLFRTVFLLYFVAPARKPIFGILILAWMFYEIWQPIRNGLIRLRVVRRANDNNPQNPNLQPNANPGMGDNGAQQQGGADVGGPIRFGARNLDAQAGALLDTLANINLQEEQVVLDRAHLEPVAEAGIGSKLTTFFGLLLSTLHPAVWNRRREALRRREGVIRTEANMRREPAPRDPNVEETEEDRRAAEARQRLRDQHARRPGWVRQYMDRVLAEEWVDDLD